MCFICLVVICPVFLFPIGDKEHLFEFESVSLRWVTILAWLFITLSYYFLSLFTSWGCGIGVFWHLTNNTGWNAVSLSVSQLQGCWFASCEHQCFVMNWRVTDVVETTAFNIKWRRNLNTTRVQWPSTLLSCHYVQRNYIYSVCHDQMVSKPTNKLSFLYPTKIIHNIYEQGNSRKKRCDKVGRFDWWYPLQNPNSYQLISTQIMNQLLLVKLWL